MKVLPQSSTYLFFSSEEASMSLNSPAMWTIPQQVITNDKMVCNTIYRDAKTKHIFKHIFWQISAAIMVASGHSRRLVASRSPSLWAASMTDLMRESRVENCTVEKVSFASPVAYSFAQLRIHFAISIAATMDGKRWNGWNVNSFCRGWYYSYLYLSCNAARMNVSWLLLTVSPYIYKLGFAIYSWIIRPCVLFLSETTFNHFSLHTGLIYASVWLASC